jgi:pimeloyl-ACP methyl ester carboxylesterase
MAHQTPEIKTANISYKGKTFSIEYFLRHGENETIVLLHGLGGAKENYYEACKSDALADHTLIFFDNPGTGNSTYHEDFLKETNRMRRGQLFILIIEPQEFIKANF